MVHCNRVSKGAPRKIIVRNHNEAGPSHSESSFVQLPPPLQPTDKVGTRGPTKGEKTWKRGDEILDIESNEWGQPIGNESSELETYLGVLARNNQLAPLTYDDWRRVLTKFKEDIWVEIEKSFNPSLNVRKHIMKSVGKKWKDYKARLKAAYYDDNLSLNERLANIPQRVHEDQWKNINMFWDSEKGKTRSAVGKKNRSKLQMGHTSGRKSLARIRDEEVTKINNGEVPSRAHVFRIAHMRKNKQPVDTRSAIVMDQLAVEEAQQPHSSSSCAASREDSLSKVLGEDSHGHVRIFGLGPSPSDVFGPQPSRQQYKRMADQAIKSSDDRVRVVESQMSDMQKTIEGLTAQIQSMKATMDGMSSARAELRKKKKVEVRKTKSKATRVELVNFKSPAKIVAVGRVISTDPNKEVGGFKLGPDFWEVYVEIAMEEEEYLIRPRGHSTKIKEVVGLTIAWPSFKVIEKDQSTSLL